MDLFLYDMKTTLLKLRLVINQDGNIESKYLGGKGLKEFFLRFRWNYYDGIYIQRSIHFSLWLSDFKSFNMEKENQQISGKFQI